MNLFIGLLNMAIEKYDKHQEFLLQKAKVIFFYYNDILYILNRIIIINFIIILL